MKKLIVFAVSIWMSLPLCAQKNFLPAARAAFGKTAAQNTVQKVAAQTAPRAGLPSAAGRVHAPAPQSKVLSAAAAQPSRAFKQQMKAVLGKKSAADQVTLSATHINLLKRFLSTPPEESEEIRQLRTMMSWYEEKTAQATNEDKIEFAQTTKQLADLMSANKNWLRNRFIENILRPIPTYSPFASKHNKLLLAALKNFVHKTQWMNAYPNKGHDALQKISSKHAISELAARLQKENLVILGEFHYLTEVQEAMAELVLTLKRQNPQRRVVVFTEFMVLPRTQLATDATLSTYFRPLESAYVPQVDANQVKKKNYATKSFLKLLKNQVEVYPLEDMTQFKLLWVESNGKLGALLSMIERNRTWARILENKMADIRQTDPDALFIVYAGQGHTSWLMPYSLPKFFANEHPAVVELSLDGPQTFTSLFTVWGKDDPFFDFLSTPALYYWTGADKRALARNSGFDYNLVIPSRTWEAVKRIYKTVIRGV